MTGNMASKAKKRAVGNGVQRTLAAAGQREEEEEEDEVEEDGRSQVEGWFVSLLTMRLRNTQFFHFYNTVAKHGWLGYNACGLCGRPHLIVVRAVLSW